MKQEYAVWSWFPHMNQWLEMGQGMSRSEAEGDVQAKYKAARRERMTGWAYVALPKGQEPSGAPDKEDQT